MPELVKDKDDAPINKLVAQLDINNAPKEESSFDILLDEVKQLRIQVNELLKPKNDMSKGIFILPNEVLRMILLYLNQMDTIHLALTHRSFDKVCKEKLFKSLYIDEVPSLINIPKKLYYPFYVKYTIIDLDRFFKLLSSFHYKPELIKSIVFANDKFVNGQTLNYIAKFATNCSIRVQDIVNLDTQKWLFEHQKTTRSDYFMFNYGSAEANPGDIPERARLVAVDQFFDRAVNEMAFSNMKRLKSIKLMDPPSFIVDEPIVVDELYLTARRDTLVGNILKWFALLKIRRLQVWCNEQSFPDTMCSLAPEFRSLHALELNFQSWDDWQKFTEKLKRDSLQEIYLPALFASLLQFKELTRLFPNHSYSLKVISYSLMREHISFRGGWDVWKSFCGSVGGPEEVSKQVIESIHKSIFNALDFHFPKLEQMIISRQVLIVDRVPRDPHLVPVEFYGGN